MLSSLANRIATAVYLPLFRFHFVTRPLTNYFQKAYSMTSTMSSIRGIINAIHKNVILKIQLRSPKKTRSSKIKIMPIS